MNDRIEELIVDYLNGTLSAEDQSEWDQLVGDGIIKLEEVEDYRTLYEALDQVGAKEPSQGMSENFYAMLNEKTSATGRMTILDQLISFLSQKGLSRGGLQAAYSLTVLVVGFGLGYLLIGRNDQAELSSLTDEVQEMKAMMMLTMLEKDSPSERIKAVTMTKNMAAVDDQIVDALFVTLNNDQNNNVRLEALEALVRYAYQPKVRTRLIGSLAKQQSPLVQLALADVMVILQDKEAKRALEEVANDQDTPDDIKELIQDRIDEIKI
jgi:hypothetical protein